MQLFENDYIFFGFFCITIFPEKHKIKQSKVGIKTTFY